MSDRSYLEEISIRNLGIIDTCSLELSKGLNVLTGETGAGKTMILTALSLLLGSKSDSSLVRHGSERLVTSATFSIPASLTAQIEDLGGLVEDGSLILTRSVSSDGKSKATASGATVNASTLGGVADPIPSNDPLSVALDLDSSSPRKRVTFEELIAEDEIDVPDFMK